MVRRCKTPAYPLGEEPPPGSFYGFTAHEMFMELRKERESFHRLFMLSIFGDTIGLPILPPYYTLRLLPYVCSVTEPVEAKPPAGAGFDGPNFP